MLKSLTYQVTFTSTGKSLAEEINFEPGFGAITGPNEAGKSFVVEMIRYALFGSAALRGKAENYQGLTAELAFLLKGTRFKVIRGAKTAILRDEQEIALGTRSVNAKIIELLGFSLDVYDVACIANQGDVERLGAMKPAERKKMVDSVIGLGVIDDLAGWAGETALELGREAETIERVTVKPVEPSSPQDYVASAVLEEEISALEAINQEYLQLKGVLTIERQAPQRPLTTIEGPAEALKTKAREQARTIARLETITQQLKTLPLARYDKEALEAMRAQREAFEHWLERQRFEARYPKPTHTRDQLALMRATWQEIDRFEETERCCKDLASALAKGHHECPKCAHRWPVEESHVERLERQISAGIQKRPATPELDPAAIRRERLVIDDYERTLAERRCLEVYGQVSEPGLSRAEIERQLAAWARATERASLEREQEALKELVSAMPDYQGMYSKRFAYEAALDLYHKQAEDYKKWTARRTEAEARVLGIQPLLALLPARKMALLASLSYEQALRVYAEQVAVYERRAAEIVSLRDQERDWRKAKAALATLRALVKQHLVPSLNRVASALVSSMTGGQRQSILVDQDFDVTVDGQPLHTLSGSAKAVANLALRIGLGQVITNNILSLFIGDEIDSSLDLDRAAAMVSTLRNLKTRISQILVVTHKTPVADYSIEIGGAKSGLYVPTPLRPRSGKEKERAR